MDFLLQYFRLFPLIAGTVWMITILTMLIFWLSEGRPNYPVHGPVHLPYISDVGAFKMKPLFITGAAISGIFFILTIFAIHHVRFDSRMHGFSDTPKASKYVRISSRAAVVFVVIAALSLIILSIFDTYRFWHVHRVLLFTLLLSTSLSVGCVNLTYYEEAKASEDLLLRRSLIAASFILLIEICLGIPFVIMINLDYQLAAVALEWAMALTFNFYLWSLIGVLGPIRLGQIKLPEEDTTDRAVSEQANDDREHFTE